MLPSTPLSCPQVLHAGVLTRHNPPQSPKSPSCQTIWPISLSRRGGGREWHLLSITWENTCFFTPPLNPLEEAILSAYQSSFPRVGPVSFPSTKLSMSRCHAVSPILDCLLIRGPLCSSNCFKDAQRSPRATCPSSAPSRCSHKPPHPCTTHFASENTSQVCMRSSRRSARADDLQPGKAETPERPLVQQSERSEAGGRLVFLRDE